MPEWLTEIDKLPRGARFFRCALHVNPYPYLNRHARATSYADEPAYNDAMVAALQATGIEVIAVVDHYRITTTWALIEAAERAGIIVFPGFEAVTKDGVHFLCLFERGSPLDKIERIVGECGVHDGAQISPIGKYDACELTEASRRWGAVVVAAHVVGDGGLLRKLSGQSAIAAWQSPDLLAASIPGPVSEAPPDRRPILENRNEDYRRAHPVALINASDVDDPDRVADPSISSWIKMSEPSIAGLRQAFLDPESRVRLASDPPAPDRTEIRAVHWDGGFLDGVSLHLNENLNVLVGGRGAGKSTVIESLRYVLDLDPIGDDARSGHDGVVRDVLRSGTRVSALVHSHHPSPANYLIERTVPNPPSVRNVDTWELLNLSPSDVAPRAEVYGQHEISEVARSPEKRTRLLERFVEQDPGLGRRKIALRRGLEQSRARLIADERDRRVAEEQLAGLPALEETVRRFRESGVEERLRERSLLVREDGTIKTASERLQPIEELLLEARQLLPIDRAFLSPRALQELPGRDLLQQLGAVLDALSADLEGWANVGDEAVRRAREGIDEVRRAWEQRRHEVESEYQRILRDLQKSNVDGAEFIQLRQQIEELRPLRERVDSLRESGRLQQERRRDLLHEWEELKADEFRRLDRAARGVSRKLSPRVRVRVTANADREQLFGLLRDQVGGRLGESIELLRHRSDLSLAELAQACRAGAGELQARFNLPSAQAQRLAAASADAMMGIEELDLRPLTEIELNVAGESEPAEWRRLDDLSTGQKATAILLLILLESDAPLIVDQPEDDLDNRFITEGIVPTMREEKRRRQFVFSTHNANVPVLGDAELIVGLSATGEAAEGQARVPPEHMGSIDIAPVRDLVETLLEGGHEAFELRRMKYGY